MGVVVGVGESDDPGERVGAGECTRARGEGDEEEEGEGGSEGVESESDGIVPAPCWLLLATAEGWRSGDQSRDGGRGGAV